MRLVEPGLSKMYFPSEFCEDNLVSGKNAVERKALTASSVFNYYLGADSARLNATGSGGAWAPSTKENQWIQVRYLT